MIRGEKKTNNNVLVGIIIQLAYFLVEITS
jgi:hypothetical protein